MPSGWLCLLLFAHAALAGGGENPLDSARWADMRKQFFAGQTVVFDDRVKVLAPQFAEDSMNVPVRVDAAELPDVREIVVIADFNPILKVLEFYPERVKPLLAFRFKLQQSSPWAAARTADGVWHVGGPVVSDAGAIDQTRGVSGLAGNDTGAGRRER